MNEAQLTTQILHQINTTPRAWAYKTHGDQFSVAGVPDIVGCCDGLLFAIEVKRPDSGEVPTRIQAVMLCRVIDAGGYAGWVDDLHSFGRLWADIRHCAGIDRRAAQERQQHGATRAAARVALATIAGQPAGSQEA